VKVAIIQFPGSNCDWDAEHSVKDVMGIPAGRVWHKDKLPDGVEAVIVPGGFSFGDYLRCGAIARFSPIAWSFAALTNPLLWKTPTIDLTGRFWENTFLYRSLMVKEIFGQTILYFPIWKQTNRCCCVTSPIPMVR
jgi:hypothetical protein